MKIKNELKVLQRKSKISLNIQKSHKPKNVIYSFPGYMTILLSLLLFFKCSFVLSEDSIYMVANVAKTTKIPVVGRTDIINSMTLNGSPMAPAQKITPIKGENIIELAYKSQFSDCSKLLMGSKATFIDMSNFDTSKCTTFNNFFSGCSSLTSIKIGDNFVTSNALDMSGMFASFGDPKSKIAFDLSRLDTSNVINMAGMFKESSFRTLDFTDFPRFDTSNVNNMESMFSACPNLISLNLSSFNLQKSQQWLVCLS